MREREGEIGKELSDKVSKVLEGIEGGSHADIKRKSIVSKGKRRCFRKNREPV